MEAGRKVLTAFLAAVLLISALDAGLAAESKVKIKVPVVIDGEEGYMVYEQYLGGDEEDPSVTITYPVEGQVFSTRVLKVRGNAEDNRGITKVDVKLNDGQWRTAEGTTTWSKIVSLREGTNIIYARATDAAGNTGSATVMVHLDISPPILQIASPTDGGLLSGAESITVTGTASDNYIVDKVIVRINGGDWQEGTGTTSWSASLDVEEGWNSVEARAMDGAGNIGEVVGRFFLDSSPPEVIITQPDSGDRVGSWGLIVKGSAGDNYALKRVEVRVDERPWQIAEGLEKWELTVSLQPGWNRVTARAVDKAGYSATASVDVYYDDEEPWVRIEYPLEDAKLNNEVIEMRGAAGDDTGVAYVEVKAGEGAWKRAAGTESWKGSLALRQGVNTLHARAVDVFGRIGEAESVVVYADTAPPSISITSPTSGSKIAQKRIRVTGTAGDENGIRSVEVRVNDNPWGKAELEPMAVIAIWPKPPIIPVEWYLDVELDEGRNIITARAIDGYGNTEETSVVVQASTVLVENGDFETGTLEGWDTTNVLNPTGGRVSDPEIVVTDRGYSVYLLSKDQQLYSWWPGSGHIDQLRKVIDGVDYDALVRMKFSVWSKYRGRTGGYLPWWGSKGVIEFRALDNDERLIKKYSIYYSPRSPSELLEDYSYAIVDWKPTNSYNRWNYDEVHGSELAREISPRDRGRISKVEMRAYVYSFGFIDGDAELWVDDFSIKAMGTP